MRSIIPPAGRLRSGPASAAGLARGALRDEGAHRLRVRVGLVRQRLVRRRQFPQGIPPHMLAFAQQALGQPYRIGGIRRHARGQRMGGGPQLDRRHPPRHQPPIQRRARVDGIAGKRHFSRPRRPDQPRQEPGAAVPGHDPQFDETFCEARPFRGNAHVAPEGQIGRAHF
ncbi:hypothetical protein G6F57_022029 [Rhizopus arrhizus]|nr:hypothetical protein G6F57_022029 [Rhizopus arrhizus]